MPAVADNDARKPNGSSSSIGPDGGVVSQHESADYLNAEINLLKPATPFMRDHLKLVWGSFIAWTLFVFGPVTATALAPDLMTETKVMGFKLHFFLTALGAPLGALILSAVYAWQRDQLDEKYGINHGSQASEGGQAVAADGGETNQ